MNTPVDLEQIEKKAWKSYFADGMWDLFIGLMMLALGVVILTDESVLGYVLMGLAVLVNPVGKKFITFPRIGHVKFGIFREKKRMKIIIIIVICVCLTLAGFILGMTSINPDEEIPKYVMGPLFAIVFLSIFSSMAYFMDFTRLYIYAVLFGLAMGITEGVKSGAGGIMLTTFGSIIILIGIYLAFKFVHRFPKPPQEVFDGNGN